VQKIGEISWHCLYTTVIRPFFTLCETDDVSFVGNIKQNMFFLIYYLLHYVLLSSVLRSRIDKQERKNKNIIYFATHIKCVYSSPWHILGVRLKHYLYCYGAIGQGTAGTLYPK
jgi:hypothetical protein